LTAKVNYTEALNNVEISKSHLVNAFSWLHSALGYGKDESRSYRLVDSLTFLPCNFTLGQLTANADSTNPLLKVNELLVNSSSVDKSLAWSSILPEFNLGLFNKKVSGDATGYYGASLSIGIPLWFMLDQRGKIMEASSNETAARAKLKTVNNVVYTQTSTAYTEFKHEENQVRLYVQEILPQAEAIFETATKSYAAGEITYIEFLQALQTLINSRGKYVDALLSYNLSIVAIEEAVGKMLKYEGVKNEK
jgi:heavy metal efflux system protein